MDYGMGDEIEFLGCGVTGIYARGGEWNLKTANFKYVDTTIADKIDGMVIEL